MAEHSSAELRQRDIKRTKAHLLEPGAFVFYNHASGAVRFQVEATAEGTMPLEGAASLLAMHCLVRGEAPSDYIVLVVPRASLLDSIGRRAQELLDAVRALDVQVRLSPREGEVLECVLRNLSNKEIGARLNVSQSTVKYHVSALLAKFNVRDRASLKREATSALHTPPVRSQVDTRPVPEAERSKRKRAARDNADQPILRDQDASGSPSSSPLSTSQR